MTKNDNIALLIDLYSGREMKKQAISYHIKKQYPVLYDEIMTTIKGANFLLNAYCYIHHISENPQCHCGKNTTFVSMTKGFSKTCSYACMGSDEKTKEKRKSTTIQKYGVENISLITRDAFSKKMKSKSVEEKAASVQKCRETCLKNYGVSNPIQSKLIRDKARKTNLEKYGVEYPTQSSKVREKMKKNNFEKYGVEFVNQIPEVHDRKSRSTYQRKQYVWKTGEISVVQGFEPIVLKELENSGYSFDQVKTMACDMPKFLYTHKNKIKRYFPDIFIPKDNIVIEVKSDYTAKCNVEVNNLKFQAVIDAGYEFRLEVR